MGKGRENGNFDLAERTARLGEETIRFCTGIRRNAITSPLISQLVRSGTSIEANYCEADEAGSKKEFKYRISVCCRESRETKYHLRMIVAAAPDKAEAARVLWKEADELNRILRPFFGRQKIEKMTNDQAPITNNGSEMLSLVIGIWSLVIRQPTNSPSIEKVANGKAPQHRHDRLRLYGSGA
ncbi:MAG: four helix bundle protein [Planctomycetales bacterium]|nr:four helix bundle protein [Planctomycetales bacterium]